MGTGNLVDQADGEVADAADVQQIINAKKEDIVPRNSSGVPTANAGALGTSTYPFKSADITTGYFQTGMIIPFHSYNNAISYPQGWYPCNGSVINESNYNSVHGAGSWATYIGSSDLDGKYAPDFDGNYPVGALTTPATGAGAIPTVGNTSHQINIAHTHTAPAHQHIWYIASGSATTADQSYQSGGATTNISQFAKTSGTGIQYHGGSGNSIDAATGSGDDLYTQQISGGNTSSSLSSTQSVQPESVEVQYLIRIV